MAKKNEKPVQINSMDDVDKALRLLSECTRRIEKAEAKLAGDVDALKAKADEALQADRAQVQGITAALEAYASENRAQLFAAGRSVKRLMGSFGFKSTPAKLVMDAGYSADDLVELLRENDMEEYIRMSESANVAMLKNCTAEQLAIVHASFESGEAFFVKLAKVTD